MKLFTAFLLLISSAIYGLAPVGAQEIYCRDFESHPNSEKLEASNEHCRAEMLRFAECKSRHCPRDSLSPRSAECRDALPWLELGYQICTMKYAPEVYDISRYPSE